MKKNISDSVLNKKLNSLYFDDSLNRIRVFSWKINSYTNIPTRVAIDTGQRNIQKIYPFYQGENVGATYLGNIGGAQVLYDFFKTEAPTSFIFQNPYQVFTETPENVKFYNTKVPFTNLRYSMAGNRTEAEEIFGLTLAENVNPALSFGINYNRFGTKGLYKNQRSKTKEFSGYVSYLGKKYSAYAGYIFNLADVKENGGIANDRDVLDTTIKPSYISVNLQNASNLIKNNTFFLSQTYGIRLSSSGDFVNNGIYAGPLILAGMYSQYSTYHRVYSDVTNRKSTDRPNDEVVVFYKNYYINPNASYDSTHLREFDNRVYLQIRPYTDKSLLNLLGGGVGYQSLRYYMFKLDDYLFGNKETDYYNIYSYGYASGKFRKYIDWNGFAKLVLAGHNAGDLDGRGSAAFSVYPLGREVRLIGAFKFKSETPNYYLNNYFSNHFVWSNNFDRVVDTRIEVRLEVPSISLDMGVRQAIVSKFIFFNKEALPEQIKGSVSISSLFFKKDIAIGHLHIDGQVLFQKTSNEDVLPLPTVAVNAGVYYQFNIVKNVLKSQLGVDVQYNKAYYAYAYNPSVGQFHMQDKRKIGDYPWLDAFANFKWKRAAIFIKVRNLGEGLAGPNDYFSALHYPRVPLQLQYGLSWSFYD
ncbi:putative porin [uncultured Acetobacteroides sp.]|uniref:putative porin n=1 Tax=uncultured Acetobacteroides sp. TaxID=1760811 RepID=UPI0029F576E7|nr:putative porin [uncultured Acetobacteroides sp.]